MGWDRPCIIHTPRENRARFSGKKKKGLVRGGGDPVPFWREKRRTDLELEKKGGIRREGEEGTRLLHHGERREK